VKHDPPKVNPKFSEKKNLSPEELEQLGHLKCNACSKILPSRRLLRRHYYADHRECMPGPLCAVCGTEFKTRKLSFSTLPKVFLVLLISNHLSLAILGSGRPGKLTMESVSYTAS
jgi:hypothetical protein